MKKVENNKKHKRISQYSIYTKISSVLKRRTLLNEMSIKVISDELSNELFEHINKNADIKNE